MKRRDVQLCMPLDHAIVRQIIAEAGHVLVQPKLKGMHLLWTGSELLSSQGKPLPALEHIRAELERLHPGVALEGECYLHDLAETNIIGLAHRAVPDEATRTLKMFIFDMIDDRPQAERLATLETLEIGQSVHLVLSEKLDQPRRLGRVRDRLVHKQGFEGLVVRDPRALWRPGKHPGVMKTKPRWYDIYTIVDVLEDARGGQAGALLMRDPEGSQFKIGSLKLNADQRRRLWILRDQAVGRTAQVSYCGSDVDGLEAACFEQFWEPWPEMSDGLARMRFRA